MKLPRSPQKGKKPRIARFLKGHTIRMKGRILLHVFEDRYYTHRDKSVISRVVSPKLDLLVRKKTDTRNVNRIAAEDENRNGTSLFRRTLVRASVWIVAENEAGVGPQCRRIKSGIRRTARETLDSAIGSQ